MSLLTDIWRQLVRRRLWPVALLLVAAIAAVPLLLAKEPEPTVDASVPPAPATTAASELVEAPIVSASEEGSRVKGRKVLGKQRDIFESTAKKPKAAKASEPTGGDEEPAQEKPAESPTEQPSTGGGGGTPVTSAPTTPATPAPKPKTYPANSLSVRFGSTDSDLAKSTLPKMKALPSAEQPLLIYMGLLKDGKTAVFLLDASASAQGDGECHPTPESCETIRLQAGETEFIDVVDAAGNTTAQFQLDLLKIHRANSDGAKASRVARVASVDVSGGLAAGALRGLGAASRTR